MFDKFGDRLLNDLRKLAPKERASCASQRIQSAAHLETCPGGVSSWSFLMAVVGRIAGQRPELGAGWMQGRRKYSGVLRGLRTGTQPSYAVGERVSKQMRCDNCLARATFVAIGASEPGRPDSRAEVSLLRAANWGFLPARSVRCAFVIVRQVVCEAAWSCVGPACALGRCLRVGRRGPMLWGPARLGRHGHVLAGPSMRSGLLARVCVKGGCRLARECVFRLSGLCQACPAGLLGSDRRALSSDVGTGFRASLARRRVEAPSRRSLRRGLLGCCLILCPPAAGEEARECPSHMSVEPVSEGGEADSQGS